MSVASPCIRICTVDAEAKVCIGCFRTLDEISDWTRMSDGERAAVNSRLSARRAAFEAATGWQRRTCERCGVEFSCGAAGDSRACWFAQYPQVEPDASLAGCLCPTCISTLPDQ